MCVWKQRVLQPRCNFFTIFTWGANEVMLYQLCKYLRLVLYVDEQGWNFLLVCTPSEVQQA